MNDSVESSGSGVSRRTVVKGAAWAAPVIAVAAVAPVAAASLPPCIESVSGQAQNTWSVGASFAGCRLNSHFDVSVKIAVKACEAETICIRVYDLGDESTGSGLRSRLWWDYVGNTAPPFLFIEKCITIPLAGTQSVSFAVEGDDVRRQDTKLASASTSVGHITACCSSTNDGIHVNPCYFSGNTANRVARFYYKLDGEPTWQDGGYISATQPA